MCVCGWVGEIVGNSVAFDNFASKSTVSQTKKSNFIYRKIKKHGPDA